MSPIERTPGGGGSSAGGLVKLFDSTLGAAAANIDTGANGVAGGHVDLVIFLLVETTQAVAQSTALLTFNGDTGLHYDYHRLSAANTVVSGSATLAQANLSLSAPGSAGGTTNYPGYSTIFIPSYTQTTFWKVGYMLESEQDTVAANAFSGIRGIGWRVTTAINQVAVAAGSGNLVAGCRMAIYGTQ